MPVAASMLVRRSASTRLPALIAVLRHGRQVPALIAGFETAGTAVALQRAAEMVRPDGQPKFPREILAELVGTGALGMRFHGF